MSDNAQVVLTPTISKVARRSVLWIGIAVAILLIVLAGIAFSTASSNIDPLSAENASPNGAKALVEVLRQQGVTVTATGSVAETEDAMSSPDETTLFVYDPNFFLNAEQIRRILSLGNHVIVLDPSYDALAEISPDLALAGYVGDTLDADCDVPAARVAEQISGEGSGYRVLDDEADVESCFLSGEDVYSLLRIETSGSTFTVLGATEALTNGEILENGNAALALNLLGERDNLVWYIPTTADFADAVPTAADLSPTWLVPASLAAFCVALAAMLWRGRRFGPLIVENLPVTVRASETMHGRARLYENAGVRLHTLDSLRIGTVARLASACGLPTLATVDEVVLAAAAAAKQNTAEVRRVLVDAVPRTDRELVALSDELLTLERLVTHNSRPH